MDLAHAATLTPLQAGTFLRNRRNELGLTADQILGLTQIPHAPYLSQLEKGKTSVGNSKHFPALARVLRLTPEEIARINPDLVTVAYACAQAMKLNLKDPSSAEFNDGMLNNDTNTVFRNSSGFYQYNSYVVAKNSFNANTTTYFECQAELEPDGQHAVVRNFQIKD